MQICHSVLNCWFYIYRLYLFIYIYASQARLAGLSASVHCKHNFNYSHCRHAGTLTCVHVHMCKRVCTFPLSHYEGTFLHINQFPFAWSRYNNTLMGLESTQIYWLHDCQHVKEEFKLKLKKRVLIILNIVLPLLSLKFVCWCFMSFVYYSIFLYRCLCAWQ
jgi:hypothetical protein